MIILALSWVGSAAAWTLVVLIDIDHFKSVNDRFGHGVGDRALVALAARVTLVLRDVDMLGRWGGEEFVVVLPETDYLQTLEKACALCTHVAAAPLVDDLAISISCGVANVVADDHAESLVQRADQALYAAKRNGRNRAEGLCVGLPGPVRRIVLQPSVRLCGGADRQLPAGRAPTTPAIPARELRWS